MRAEEAPVKLLRSYGVVAVGTLVAVAGMIAPAGADPQLPAPLVDTDFYPVSRAKVRLGRLLFYDPILSGNRNISCATCHHPQFGTGDGVSLAIGEGGSGLGPARRPADGENRPERRIGRNAPALFNLGARAFRALFFDGRLERDPSRPGGYRTPIGEDMVSGFDGLLSAQTMFPVLSADEMAGHYNENDISKAVRKGEIAGPGGAWDRIARRVAALPVYLPRFREAFPHIRAASDIGFTDIANAIAEFISFEWRATDSPFDRYLNGDKSALASDAKRGLDLFFGKAGCASCHRGSLLTDHAFHAIAMPQFGPGRTARFEDRKADTGRMRVTGRKHDGYRFRTPSLRNVAHTAPYGHSGAYHNLEDVVRHHLDPVASLYAYDRENARLPAFPEAEESDWSIMDDPDQVRLIAESNEFSPVSLEDHEVSDLIAFLRSLTDPIGLKGRLGRPDRVPSGLPVD